MRYENDVDLRNERSGHVTGPEYLRIQIDAAAEGEAVTPFDADEVKNDIAR